MKVLFQNEIVLVEHDEENKLLKHTWSDKTQDIEDAAYKINDY